MTDLDVHNPWARVNYLEEVQMLIDQLWGVLSEKYGRIEQLRA